MPMKRFSVALPDVVLQGVERVAKANHWSRERAARILIREALVQRERTGDTRLVPTDSSVPAEMIHRDRDESVRSEVQLEIGGLG